MYTSRMSVSLIGGRFDEGGGRPSKVFNELLVGVTRNCIPRPHHDTVVNGGPVGSLPVLCDLGDDIVFWMPDVPNTVEDKLIEGIKKKWPRTILVMSKAMYDRDMGIPELLQRMLAVKANLCLAITREGGRYHGMVIDPLGNVFARGDNFVELGDVAFRRAVLLSGIRRVGSESVGPAEPPDVPSDFLAAVRRMASRFDELIPRPGKVDRFLGNAAFRCSHGFPAFRSEGGRIYVTRRNVDKTSLTPDGFVAVDAYEPFVPKVRYHGEYPPSVDTPIQVLLFNAFPYVKYMVHGHVYMEGVSFTDRVLPCGAIEEFHEIMNTNRRWGSLTDWTVNLRGHGFLAMASTVSWWNDRFLERLIPRPVPEEVPDAR